MKWYDAKGDAAARLRQRKHAMLRRFQIPSDALPGSLALTHRRCGKPSCHCAQGQGHPVWSLTFMGQGRKRVERIPEEWVRGGRPRVESGRKFKQAVAEIFAANAQLLVLKRKQHTRSACSLTRFGWLRTSASRCCGRRCHQERRPLSEWLGVEPGRVSCSLARLVALLAVVAPYEPAARLIQVFFRAEVSPMTVW